MNAKMPELRKAFEAAGFTDVRTVLSSGNLVFSARSASESFLQRIADAALKEQLGRAFLTIVRPIDALRAILASDPYRAFRLSPSAKRIVTFLRDEPRSKVTLPLALEGTRLLCLSGRELFSAYVPSPKGVVFMSLIERTFGKELTTRTWGTLGKVARV
jgi:uncharacterized protein (DUF1697 family)